MVPLCITAFITNYSLSSLSFSNSFFCNVKITSLLTLALMLNMLSISEGCSRVISQNPFCRFTPPNDSLEIAFSFVTYPFHLHFFSLTLLCFTLFLRKTQRLIYIINKNTSVCLCSFYNSHLFDRKLCYILLNISTAFCAKRFP